ncbi:hypothetical protein L798_10948 [Zootermopsis nevadensis]|uniref:Uncharacterized protein n=2 Tax=Zootermopsis nevadensis TaxID=136037 RepID=A0A067QZS6_ZOONE|nr:hypothetical protein L798_10948 [Zootermopsis nevadensis]
MEPQMLVLALSLLCHLSDAVPTDDGFPSEDITSCKISSGVTDDEAKALQESKTVQDESNDSHKCFVACLITQYGLMKDDKMDVEFLVAVMKTARPENVTTFDDQKEAEYRKNVNDCNKETGEGKCGSGYNVWKCFSEMSVRMALAEMAENS